MPIGSVLGEFGAVSEALTGSGGTGISTPSIFTPAAAPSAPLMFSGVGTTIGATGATSQGYRNSILTIVDKGTESKNDALISLDIVYQGPAARTITDGVITTNTTFTSATAAFTADDVGAAVNTSPAPRSVTDAVFTSGQPTFTSATASFVNAAFPAGDVGRPLNPSGGAPTTGGPIYSVIPAGTTILSVQSGTNATMSANAGASATGMPITIGQGNSIASVQSPTSATLAVAATNGTVLTLTITDIIRTTGVHSKIYTPNDNGGDTSAFLGVQTGGGSGASFYKLGYLKPAAFTDLSASPQGALEAGTGDQSQAAAFFSGYQPQAYKNAGLPIMASNAIYARIDNPSSKGILVSPNDGNFDTRLAYAVGLQALNANDTAIKFSVTLAGTINSTGVGQATNDLNTAGALGGSIQLLDTGAGAGNGGAIIFGAGAGYFGAIKGFLNSNANNTNGHIIVATRNVNTDAALTERIRVKNTGDIIFNGSGITLQAGTHIVGGNPGSAVSIANGANIGTGSPSTSISGTDTAGQLTIVTGTAPGAAGALAVVTFGLAFAAAPKAVLLSPANNVSSIVATTGDAYVAAADIAAGSFTVRMPVPAAGATYIFNYVVIG